MKSRIKLEIKSRQPFAEGMSFSTVGAYEALNIMAYYAVDPEEPSNRIIVDIDKAPRNQQGLVEFSGSVNILKPLDMTKGNRRLVYDVPNRGVTRILLSLNDASQTPEPISKAEVGNGFMMRRGYTVAWSGWQGDLNPTALPSTLEVPLAKDNGREITGPVRVEFIAETSDVVSLPLSGSPAIKSYEALSMDTTKATLTRRKLERDPRELIASGKWQFASVDAGGNVTSSATSVYLPEGFKPGWIYELIYQAKDPKVLGVGFISIRELMDFLRYSDKDDEGTTNPLREQGEIIEKAYGWGRSQSGRILRGLAHLGFNEASQGRKIFDGMVVQAAGAGLHSINYRFAQPGRFSRQHEDHLYPANAFPFAYSTTTDPYSGKTDGVLKRPDTDPLILHTQTSTEYWQLRGSLVHTDPVGNDLPDNPKVRFYLFSGAQHYVQPGDEGPKTNLARYPSNPLTYTPFCRSMMDILDRWVTEGTPPPGSRVPTRKDGTLVQVSEASAAFPKIPGIHFPAEANHLEKVDFGPEFDKGIITQEPPVVNEDQQYGVLVPQVDEDGNETSGIKDPLLQAPTITYTGWNLRTTEFDNKAISSLYGTSIPFAKTEAERKASGDPRPSLEERYNDQAAYMGALRDAVEDLKSQGLLLEEDAQGYHDRAAAQNPFTS